ncbi:MAG: hypothetical protein JWR14_5462 [Caballeronia sp.]|nr:hypothetical protein [Caballeronia sp.]
MRGIRDGQHAEFDPFISQHYDEFRTASQVEMGEQMTDVFLYRNVLESHSKGDSLGGKSAR